MKTTAEDNRVLDDESREIHLGLMKTRDSDAMPIAHPVCPTICDEKKFIWFQVPKSASRTVYYHLRQHVHLDCEHPYDILIPINRYRNYFKFGFVRNPWDRLVSCWISKVAQNNKLFRFPEPELERMRVFSNFVDWVAGQDMETCNVHLRLQCRLIDLGSIDYVGRVENMDRDYAEVCRLLDIPMDGYEHRNGSSRRQGFRGYTGPTIHYRDFYDHDLAEKVFRIYRKDIQIFGYRF
uniref:Sulfotransferase family protein n=1 Tax=Candidatus Kentrum sp. FW TaxID=2126338 RepID=A0A450TP23_9GAMM|nr:MAG: Sulfotransferase family protein [Candidatus Kentron sp. FW]